MVGEKPIKRMQSEFHFPGCRVIGTGWLYQGCEDIWYIASDESHTPIEFCPLCGHSLKAKAKIFWDQLDEIFELMRDECNHLNWDRCDYPRPYQNMPCEITYCPQKINLLKFFELWQEMVKNNGDLQ